MAMSASVVVCGGETYPSEILGVDKVWRAEAGEPRQEVADGCRGANSPRS